ncbi:MAG: hypothetical protein ACJ73N_14470 [Bryobacteraceae bacterium]
MSHGADFMEPDKNLHIKIPPALLAEMENAASAEHITVHITVDELVQDAVERRLHRRQWQDVLSFGERHAKARGLTEADVNEAIAEVRRENQERGR